MTITHTVAVALGTTALLLGAGACGSDADGDAGEDTRKAAGPGYEQGAPQGERQGQAGNFPGANGKVAAVDGSTAQVQGMQGQVAVTWTGSTTFTKEVSGALADIEVGSCVLVGSDEAASSGSTPATQVTATSVRITPMTDGSCGPGLRGPGGTDGGPRLDGTPPPDVPDGGDRPQVRAIGGAVGEVTAVAADGFTVSSSLPGGDETTTVTVTVSDRTTYTRTAEGAASDVEVGVCVAATGTTDETGAVTAKTIAVSQPRDGECGAFVRMRSDDAGSTQES